MAYQAPGQDPRARRELPQNGPKGLEGEKTDLLGFVEFGHLAQIMIAKWEHFEVIPSQHWLKQRMDEMEKVRHFIAHNRMLLPSEFQRLYMYIADWSRVVGL